MGVVVNRTMVTPNKSKHVLVLLMNTNSYNVWIQQPLLAANVVEAEHCPWDYQSFLSCNGNEVKVTFHPTPTPKFKKKYYSSLLVRYLVRILRINLVQRKVVRSLSLDLNLTLMILILIFVNSLKDFLFP